MLSTARFRDREYVRRLVHVFLPVRITAEDVIAAFPVLSPSSYEIKLRHRLEKIRLYPMTDPRRRPLEDALAADLAPVAKKIATSAAWKMNHPEYAEEVWGEGVFLAIRHQDPARGLFLSYLRSRIAGLLGDCLRRGLQTGTEAILRAYGTDVRAAEEELRARFGRVPSDEEIARHLNIRPHTVGEVRRAWAACSPVSRPRSGCSCSELTVKAG